MIYAEFNPLKIKRRVLYVYLKTQFVPCTKIFETRF